MFYSEGGISTVVHSVAKGQYVINVYYYINKSELLLTYTLKRCPLIHPPPPDLAPGSNAYFYNSQKRVFKDEGDIEHTQGMSKIVNFIKSLLFLKSFYSTPPFPNFKITLIYVYCTVLK